MSDLNFPHGPREYIIERCPYCNRRLAEWFAGEGHVTILHPKASIKFGINQVDLDMMIDTPPRPVKGSATCMRLTCRLRRRFHPPLTPEVP